MESTQFKEEDLKYYIHKLNNLMTIIQGNAELIKLKTNFEEAEDIILSCQKSLEIIRSITVTQRYYGEK